jgi:hypothetical protein
MDLDAASASITGALAADAALAAACQQPVAEPLLGHFAADAADAEAGEVALEVTESAESDFNPF